MKEEFKRGEVVAVRNSKDEPWIRAHYLGHLPDVNWYITTELGKKQNFIVDGKSYTSKGEFTIPDPWVYIRKIPSKVRYKGFSNKQKFKVFECELDAKLKDLELKTDIKFLAWGSKVREFNHRMRAI